MCNKFAFHSSLPCPCWFIGSFGLIELAQGADKVRHNFLASPSLKVTTCDTRAWVWLKEEEEEDMMSVGRKRMIKMLTMLGFPGIRCSGFLASLIIWQLGDVWIVASCYHCKVNISRDPFDYGVLISGYWGLWGWRYHGFKLLNYHWRKTADSSLYSIPNGPHSRKGSHSGFLTYVLGLDM